jgi:hypothetical protein
MTGMTAPRPVQLLLHRATPSDLVPEPVAAGVDL